jgi:hypothetical protein
VLRSLPAAGLAALLITWIGIAWSGQYPPFYAQRQQAESTDHSTAIFVTRFEDDGGSSIHSYVVSHGTWSSVSPEPMA